MYDADGKQYLDAAGGALVVSIGYGVKPVLQAMSKQAEQVVFAHGSQFITKATTNLAGAIAKMTPGDLDRVYFVSGGSEATEAALKLARQYQVEVGRPSKYKVISRWHSYHGATLAAVAMSGIKGRRAIYEPLLLDVPHIPPAYCYRCPLGKSLPSCQVACADELEQAILKEGPDTVAAFIAEPVVGAALGAVSAPEEYFRKVREICDRYDVLWIADEVMTGVGRTGRNFGVEHDGALPDLMALAKGLSSGYAPIGALVVRQGIYDAIAGGSGSFVHGHTYGQHPVSCAAALAVLEYLHAENLVARAREMGQVFLGKLESLRNLSSVGDIRGKGMMLGVELVRESKGKTPYPPEAKIAQRVFEMAFSKGLITYPGSGSADQSGGDHLLLGPHFITTEAEADEIVNILGESIAEVEKQIQ